MYNYVTEVESIGCEILRGAGSCSTLSYAVWGPTTIAAPGVFDFVMCEPNSWCVLPRKQAPDQVDECTADMANFPSLLLAAAAT